ncbi:hypothetical protein KFL_003950140 [Klebsormidium nitens]|uniref:Uncharacterized protein n=1 Tax=Klebsormidium nitens TaxID=105231 RepID=A0A1Y1IH53_KLENI|nr:hypothetical protein KFL_003950140 [Klebsormidium nitens]|eukprot:GAQ88037.1 hypothetical protein KFL_003950140 [Klebsormidium nitens]
MSLKIKSPVTAAKSIEGEIFSQRLSFKQLHLHNLSLNILSGRVPFQLHFSHLVRSSAKFERAPRVTSCQAASARGTLHHLTPATPFRSSPRWNGRTRATTESGQSGGPREGLQPEEEEEEEFWVYTGDDELSRDDEANEPADVSGGRSRFGGKGRGDTSGGNPPQRQRTREREDFEDSLMEEREYTEADLAAVDEEYEELLRAVQQRQESGADWPEDEEDEDDFPVTSKKSFGYARDAQTRAGDGPASPSPRKIQFGGREWDEPRSISENRGSTGVGGHSRGRHQNAPFEDSFARNNNERVGERRRTGRERAQGQASGLSDSARRSGPEPAQWPQRTVLSREEARRRDEALMQERSWWGGGGRGSASYGDEYDGRRGGLAWDGASLRRREGATRGGFQGRSSGGREERFRQTSSEGASSWEGGGEGEAAWDDEVMRQRRGSVQGRDSEGTPREPLREEQLRGRSDGTAFSGGSKTERNDSIAGRDDLAEIMDSICGPETDLRPQVSGGKGTRAWSNSGGLKDGFRGDFREDQIEGPRGGLRGGYEEPPAEMPARAWRDGVRNVVRQHRDESSRRGEDLSGGSFTRAGNETPSRSESWADGASETAAGLGAESILAEESERLSENVSPTGDDPSKSSRKRRPKPVIPEGGWTSAEGTAPARGVFAERIEHRGFVRKVPDFVKTGGMRGVPERRYGTGGDEWARREAKWFGDDVGFQGKRDAGEKSENDADADDSVTTRSFYQAAPGARRTSESSAPGTFRTSEPLSAPGRPQQVVPGWAQPKTAPLVPEEVSAREERQRRFFEQKEQAARKKQADEYHKRGRALLLSRQGTYQKMKRRQEAKRRKKLEYMEMAKQFEEKGLKLYKAPSWLDQKDGELDEEPDDLMEDIGRKLEIMGMLPPRADS